MPKKLDLAGQRFGRLLVLAPTENSKTGFTRWVCRCDCGNEISTYTNGLRSGHAKSCGCINKEQQRDRHLTHGMSATKLYKAWVGMIGRCENKSNSAYKNYGGRGIKVCDRWKNFENFAIDVGDRPISMTLDREDNNGNYEPSNWRWATWNTQSTNKRNTVFLTFEGETLPLADWARRMNTTGGVLKKRFEKFNTVHPLKSTRKKTRATL
jgi:hypothetical protein